MDGNGRWAESHGVSVADGHRAGARALRRTVEAGIELGVDTLVVYAFSTENWGRPPDEVADLMDLLSETIDGELPDLAGQGVRTRFFGRRDRLAPWLLQKMTALENETAGLDDAQSLDRVRLRRSRRARPRGQTARRGRRRTVIDRRGGDRLPPLRTGNR